jgi:PGF-pre-PGF domain-containing protein
MDTIMDEEDEIMTSNHKKTFVIILTTLFVSNLLIFMQVGAVEITTFDVAPSLFSPDQNGLNDTTTFTANATASQSLYVNIFYDGSLVREDQLMTESPAGTYKYTWNGKNDSDSYVEDEGTYTIKISDNPSENGETEGTIEVDLTAPSSPALSINGGTGYTTTRNVNLTISAVGATKMKVSNYANFSGATWENYATTKSWQLSSNDGDKTVYINFRDAAGTNCSTSDDITLDTVIGEPSLSINSGASHTNDLNVTLSISANDATKMKIDNESSFSNMTSWINKASPYNFTLPAGGDGIRTVYLRVKDDAGNTKTTSDTITLDTQPPSDLSISINNNASYTNSTNVSLSLYASGGPAKMYLRNGAGTWLEYDYDTSIYWNLVDSDGSRTVYFKAADAAGNNATAVSASITLDTTPPSAVTLVSPSTGATVSTQSPSFNWTNTNPSGTKIFYIEILQSGVVKQSSFINSTTTSYTAETLAPGSYQWRVTVYDMANNSAATSQRSFTISISGLAIPSPTYPTIGAQVNSSAPNMVRLRWSQVSGQGTISYDYKYGNAAGNLVNTGSTTNLYADLPGGAYSHGDQIFWCVRARNTTNVSSYSTIRSCEVDTEAPILNSIFIKSNDTYTSTKSVTLTLSATGATWMMLSENSDFSGASWTSYKSSSSFTLSSGDGTKTVYFKAKDSAVGDQGSTSYANVNSTAISDSIVLDTTSPSITSPFPSSSTTETKPEISASYSDAGSGIDTSTVIIYVDGVDQTYNATISIDEVSYIPSTSLGTGTHTVNVSVSDDLSHIGYLEWTFTISIGDGGDDDDDEEDPEGMLPPPTSPAISISEIKYSPTTVTSSDEVNFSATIIATNGVYRARLYYSYEETSKNVKMSNSSNSYYATVGPFPGGVKVTYWIHVTDNNASYLDSDKYSFTVVDTTKPSISIVSPIGGSSVTDRTPTIQATFSDSGGIDSDSILLTVDSVDVTALSTITSSSITHMPAIEMTLGTHAVTLELSDVAGNTQTKSWSFSIVQEVIGITEVIDELISGTPETINLTQHNTALDSISVTTTKNLQNVAVTVQTLSEIPQGVTPPPKEVYLYLDLEISSEESDLSSVKLSFKVEQSWLSQHNIDKDSIILLRYHNNSWQELLTSKINENATYVYYEAETQGLSTFAIAGSIKITQDTGFPWIFVIIGIVAAAIVVLFFLFKMGFLYIEDKHQNNKDNFKIKNNKQKGKK